MANRWILSDMQKTHRSDSRPEAPPRAGVWRSRTRMVTVPECRRQSRQESDMSLSVTEASLGQRGSQLTLKW